MIKIQREKGKDQKNNKTVKLMPSNLTIETKRPYQNRSIRCRERKTLYKLNNLEKSSKNSGKLV